MGLSYEELERLVRELDGPHRRRLVDILLETIDDEVGELSPEWEREIEARIHDYENGNTELHDADKVIAEARRRLG